MRASRFKMCGSIKLFRFLYSLRISATWGVKMDISQTMQLRDHHHQQREVPYHYHPAL
jgi:hypothetical protein